MIFLITIKLCFILKTSFAGDSEIIRAMREHEVIPDVINEGPKGILKVSFNSDVMVYMGMELTPTQVQNEPKVEWSIEKGIYYTLLLTEPDAPSRKETSLKEWIHWLIVNIPDGDISKGDLIYGYQGSGPDKATGFHRYVYLLFKQPEKLQFYEKYSAANSIEGRPKFSTMKFCEKYNLGVPIAGNFYIARYDKYSDILLAKLGLSG